MERRAGEWHGVCRARRRPRAFLTVTRVTCEAVRWGVQRDGPMLGALDRMIAHHVRAAVAAAPREASGACAQRRAGHLVQTPVWDL